mmetsp:Transcript_19429/g.40727  ORF Transcript_19429/g.40727 Transcript_19429/m.40727 type:complete len:550 (-) Transcript_19429:205-1854(-)|eukprot:CAMPEP_0171327758 /NCGR_PEP_ID=MMETSP0878-20121228/225_1 /TAXON_ID=67004 /ORGANISM="Thalassiosira weissflogii, Strain CCMP1336" /LENGTH=549 /DNA_ID=CAMNT_0011827557 /DNA_START=121 /DNA_END=1770 /DNA_ORIENTATION=-
MRFFGIKHKDSSRKTRNSLSEQIVSASGVKDDRFDLTDIKKNGGRMKARAPLPPVPTVAAAPIQHLQTSPKKSGGIAIPGKSPLRQAVSPRGSNGNDNNKNPESMHRVGSASRLQVPGTPPAPIATRTSSRPKSSPPEIDKLAGTAKPRQESAPLQLPPRNTPNVTPQKHSTPGQNNGTKVPPKGPPPSILHKKAHYATTKAAQTPSRKDYEKLSSPASDGSPLYTIPASEHPTNHNNRVRFLSSSSSVASTEASEVHLMAGAGSVASSAMSSSKDSDNIFDKVFNMVMAEEGARLNAMGMNRSGSWRGDSHPTFVSHSGSSEDSLGLTSPGGLAPIDMDTGLEIGEKNKAPIDVDTGLEIQFNHIDDEYHDMNDDDIDEAKWNMLNGTALNINQDGVETVTKGAGGLALDSRRVRSDDISLHHQNHPPIDESYHQAMSQGSEHRGIALGGSANTVISQSDLKAMRHDGQEHHRFNHAPKNLASQRASPSKGTESPSGRGPLSHDAYDQRNQSSSGSGQVSPRKNSSHGYRVDKWAALGGEQPTSVDGY